MSGLKQKAKKRLGEMERTCGLTITDSLGVDITDGVIEIILGDAEEEISYYKKMANKYTKETYLLKEEIEKLKERLVIVKGQRDGFDSMHGELEAKLGQIREHTKNFPKIEIFALEMLSGDKKIQMTKDEWLQIKRWKEQLVGLLGQNYEKPEPKKEEKQVNE